MSRPKREGVLVAGVLMFGLGFSAIPAERAMAAEDPACAAPTSELQQNPLASVTAAERLYRFQARPWARVPQGVALTLPAPEGATEADMHRVLTCAARDPEHAGSALAVAGSSLRVQRRGAHYVVYITAEKATAAREIQRRTSALQ